MACGSTRGNTLQSVVAYVGHKVHVVRRREVGTLLDWLGASLAGRTLLDVGGGDGYWAGQARRRGAVAVALDLAHGKLVRGARLPDAPHLVEGDALSLPFDDASFDVVLSVCAIEHFPSGEVALDEMSRVLKPGGDLVLSADCLSLADRWPRFSARHRRRYHVVRTYDAEDLRGMLKERGLDVLRDTYLFRDPAAQRLYFGLSRWRYGYNVAAPLAPIVAGMDRRSRAPGGAVVLVHARRPAE